MPVCIKCYAEFGENDCVFCPDRGFLCSSCSNQEHVVSCLDCGEHFPFYSMKEIDGRALCEADYNREMKEKELEVEPVKISIRASEKEETVSELTADLYHLNKRAESKIELKEDAAYEETSSQDEFDIPWVIERKTHETPSEGENTNIKSEEIIKDSRHPHHGCHGHHPIFYY